MGNKALKALQEMYRDKRFMLEVESTVGIVEEKEPAVQMSRQVQELSEEEKKLKDIQMT